MGGGSGGSTTTTVDPKYNKGMLNLSKEQQEWAGEMFNMFKYGVTYNPEEKVLDPSKKKSGTEQVLTGTKREKYKNPDYTPGSWDQGVEQWLYKDVPQYEEQNISKQDPDAWTTLGELEGYDPDAQVSEMQYLQNLVEANQSLLGLKTEGEQAQIELDTAKSNAALGLLPSETSALKTGFEYTTGLNTAREELLPAQTALAKKGIDFQSSFLDEAGKGVDEGKWMDQAQAGVQHGYKLANKALRKDIASYGLDPGSGRYTSQSRDMRMREASGVAGARTSAQRSAEQEDFKRKGIAAMGLKIPTF